MTIAIHSLRQQLPRLEASVAVAFGLRNLNRAAWSAGLWSRRRDAARCRARRLARLLRRVSTLPPGA